MRTVCKNLGLYLQTSIWCRQIPVFLIAQSFKGQRGQIGCWVPRRSACSVEAGTQDQQPIAWSRTSSQSRGPGPAANRVARSLSCVFVHHNGMMLGGEWLLLATRRKGDSAAGSRIRRATKGCLLEVVSVVSALTAQRDNPPTR